ATLPSVAGASSSLEYWSAINRLIAAGMVNNGRQRVITEALRRFPYNQVLLAGAGPASWRVLFVGASATKLSPVPADRELRTIRDIGGPFDVRDVPAATATDLGRIRTDRPDLLHLACHGRGALLVFGDGHGGSASVHAARVADTLRVYRDELGVRLSGILL